MVEKEQAWEVEKVQIAEDASKNSSVVGELQTQLDQLSKENHEMSSVLKNQNEEKVEKLTSQND